MREHAQVGGGLALFSLLKKNQNIDLADSGRQLRLKVDRPLERDRNHARGGRSFYFFDFDDNIAILATPILIFHKVSKKPLRLTSREFAAQSKLIGIGGTFKDYEVNWDDQTGSFQYFRDQNLSLLARLMGQKQMFVQDLLSALSVPEYHWQGPSWNCFYHAVYNSRPVSLITARGHNPQTIKNGIFQWVREGHISQEPNYLSIYPVNYPPTRKLLGKNFDTPVAELKQAAIRASVEQAFTNFGFNVHHRFGMSDDDPRNIELILDEMTRLKKEYPENSFFVFDTHNGRFLRREVFVEGTQDKIMNSQHRQLTLF